MQQTLQRIGRCLRILKLGSSLPSVLELTRQQRDKRLLLVRNKRHRRVGYLLEAAEFPYNNTPAICMIHDFALNAVDRHIMQAVASAGATSNVQPMKPNSNTFGLVRDPAGLIYGNFQVGDAEITSHVEQ
jgi:hypothetical protein